MEIVIHERPVEGCVQTDEHWRAIFRHIDHPIAELGDRRCWLHAGCAKVGQRHFRNRHPLGYEHAFINQAADMFRILGGQEPELPLPDFDDAYQTQRVLEAIELCAQRGAAVKLADVK